MTKEKFASALTKELKALGVKMRTDEAERFVSALSRSMSEGIAKDKKLIVSNFGSFEAIKIGAKVINSPRGDNKKFFMPPTEIIKWHPSGKIKEKVGSSEISDEEFNEIKSKKTELIEDTEDIKVIFSGKIAEAPEPIEKIDPFEVKVRYKARSHNFDKDKSPINRFIKSLFRQMFDIDCDKFVIAPSKTKCQANYYSEDQVKLEKNFPKETHGILLKEIKEIFSSNKPVMIFDQVKVEFQTKLTPFGEEINIIKVK